MGSPIIFKDLSGLAEGITQAGGALGQALGHRMEKQQELQQKQKYGTALQTALNSFEGRTPTPNELYSTISKFPVEYQKTAISLYGPLLKEESKNKSRQDELDSIMGRDKGALPGQPEEQTGVISGVSEPIREEVPLEDLTIQTPEGYDLSRDQIKQMIGSPHESTRRLGESYEKEYNEKEKENRIENREIKKENRHAITKFSEDYQDSSKFAANVNRLENVKKIIADNPKDFDKPFWRTAMGGLLEGKEIAEVFKSQSQQKVFSLLKPFLSPKEIGGSNPSTREMMFNYETLVGPMKGVEANEYIAELFLNEALTLQEKGKQVKKFRNKDLTFSEFQTNVDERVGAFSEERQKSLVNLQEMHQVKAELKNRKPEKGKVFIYNKETGKIHSVDKNQRKAAEEQGYLFVR
tara:strand:- start:1049 stop:2275 length:1227 start_codon:yes stop_codon:yes gene_type:complete